MKKLLCIVCLLASVLFVNAADASIGSPMRNGYVGTTTVSVSKTVAPRMGMNYHPTHYSFHSHSLGYRGFHNRHLGYHNFHKRHFGHYGFKRRHFGRYGFRHFGRRFSYAY